ncbi:MAG: hypothetical protein O3C67_06370, partial [Cyanobacteria bacterium]|nr:hypothetical protein [Cyanobacteriota bacterium]
FPSCPQANGAIPKVVMEVSARSTPRWNMRNYRVLNVDGLSDWCDAWRWWARVAIATLMASVLGQHSRASLESIA